MDSIVNYEGERGIDVGIHSNTNFEGGGIHGKKRKRNSANDGNTALRDSNNCSSEDLQPTPMRRNIRDVINANQLDMHTLVAQREESERLARLAVKEKALKEIQLKQNFNKYFVLNELLGSSGSDAHGPKIIGSLNEGQNSCSTDSLSLSGTLRPNLGQQSVNESVNLGESEVVTVEDSSSSDDDCILISDDEEDNGDEEDDGDEEDERMGDCGGMQDSGIHVNDVYNTRDEFGRVVVNIGHPEDEENIYLAPQVSAVIKPHQIGGIRFLYDNIVESITRFKKSSGFGCILAHSMGLGKTLQIVSFCDIFLRHTDAKRILCVMPINTLQNWHTEFNMWIPRVADATSNIRPRTFDVFVLNDQQKTFTARANVILKWSNEGGVLLIGYELFRLIALKIVPARKKKEFKGVLRPTETLINKVHEALVDPGPDLVVCDEGHRIKNAHAGISLALKQIKTRRRVVLTGYPLQNNLQEYWCMVDFVRPNYLGTRTEFCNMFERPIQNGQCADSTPTDIKLMRFRAHVLHSLLVGFVQRRSHEVLQKTLPAKLEYVILVKMSDFQRKLYDTLMANVRKKTFPNPLKAFAVCCKIWNHPDVLYNYIKKSETDRDLEIDEELLKPVSLENLKTTSTECEDVCSILGSPVAKALNGKSYSYSDFSSAPNIKTTHKSNINSMINSTDSGGLEIKSGSYWLNPTTPSYVGITVNELNHNLSSNLGRTYKESQLVDLDTKEIKTVECDLRDNCFLQSKHPNQSEHISDDMPPQVSVNIAANEQYTKTQRYKKSPEFSCLWATDIMKNYQPGILSNSPKMCIFFSILKWSLCGGERVLLFSQSLLTLDLIENYIRSMLVPGEIKYWKRNCSYFRLDGSTSSQERERLVCEFNSNKRIKLFLISTRAGSLGINLTGANRVIIFDASWNPCHDTQAVYRIYRYGQQKQCYIYRLVMDKCLEKKIYDRQIKKQGMSNRVVDECNPEAHLSIRDSNNLCIDYDSEEENKMEYSCEGDKCTNDSQIRSTLNPNEVVCEDDYCDPIIRKIVEYHKDLISKNPFFHESLLADRKDSKLSRAEKKQAYRSYELDKKAAVGLKSAHCSNKLNTYLNRSEGPSFHKSMVSIRPIVSKKCPPVAASNTARPSRWIPADVWERQGMTSQELILPLDVVIPTNCSQKVDIVLKAGQRVMVLKSPKGIYMQLENGKIISIRTSKNDEKEKLRCDNAIEVIDITSDSDIDEVNKTKATEDGNLLHNQKAATSFAPGTPSEGFVAPKDNNLQMSYGTEDCGNQLQQQTEPKQLQPRRIEHFSQQEPPQTEQSCRHQYQYMPKLNMSHNQLLDSTHTAYNINVNELQKPSQYYTEADVNAHPCHKDYRLLSNNMDEDNTATCQLSNYSEKNLHCPRFPIYFQNTLPAFGNNTSAHLNSSILVNQIGNQTSMSTVLDEVVHSKVTPNRNHS